MTMLDMLLWQCPSLLRRPLALLHKQLYVHLPRIQHEKCTLDASTFVVHHLQGLLEPWACNPLFPQDCILTNIFLRPTRRLASGSRRAAVSRGGFSFHTLCLESHSQGQTVVPAATRHT